MKYGETEDEQTSIDAEVRQSSLSTLERLQEEIIQLEADKRRLRRNVDHLRDEERLLTRRLDLRPRDTGTPAWKLDGQTHSLGQITHPLQAFCRKGFKLHEI